jgi:hypothetical protein
MKYSWYQAFWRISSVGGRDALGWPTDSTASDCTRSGKKPASSQLRAAPQSWPITCTLSAPWASSTATRSAATFISR